METLRDFIKMQIQFVQSTFDEREMMPMFIAQSESDEIYCIATPFSNTGEKNAVVAAMREMFKLKKIIRYVFISEAWASTAKTKKEADEALPPSMDPNRKEIVIIVGEDRKETLGTEIPISRKDGKRILGKPHDLAACDGGRFEGLIRTGERLQ